MDNCVGGEETFSLGSFALYAFGAYLNSLGAEIQKINSEKEGGSAEFYTALLEKLKELCGVLNILNKDIQAEVPAEIQALVDERTQARKNKDFAKADEIRAKLTEMGVILEDTKDGVKILIKK